MIGNIDTRGFTLNSQVIDTNIGLLVIDGSKMYDIRYWLSDVEMRKKMIMLFEKILNIFLTYTNF